MCVQVYEAVGKGVVEGLFEGYNGTIFAYGQIRFRAPAEPFIVILCAIALSAIGRQGASNRNEDPLTQ